MLLRVVARLIVQARRLVSRVEKLFSEELAERVGLGELVVAVRVRPGCVLALLVRVVRAVEVLHQEVGYARLTGVLAAVAVEVDEDMTLDPGEPHEQRQDTHVDDLPLSDSDVELIKCVVLRLVPDGQRVVAVGHVLDIEMAVGVSRPGKHCLTVATEVHVAESDHSQLYGPVELYPREARVASGTGYAVQTRDIVVRPVYLAFDLPADAAAVWDRIRGPVSRRAGCPRGIEGEDRRRVACDHAGTGTCRDGVALPLVGCPCRARVGQRVLAVLDCNSAVHGARG